MNITVGEFTEILASLGVTVKPRGDSWALGYKGGVGEIVPLDPLRVMPIQEVQHLVAFLEIDESDKTRLRSYYPDLE